MSKNTKNLLIVVCIAIVIVLCVRVNININTTDEVDFKHEQLVENDLEVVKAYYDEIIDAYENGMDTSVYLSNDVLSIFSNRIKHFDGSTTMLEAGEYAYYKSDNKLGYYLLYKCDNKHSNHEYRIGE